MKKIELYKNNLIDYENKQKINNSFLNNFDFDDMDYIIGILFLTKMNMYCKNNNFTAHGYYMAYALMTFFNVINNTLKNDNKIESDVVCYFWTSLTNNIIYLKERINSSPTINQDVKKNVAINMYKFMNEISIIITKLVSHNLHYINNVISEDKHKSVKDIYCLFFLTLLTCAKFFGSGEYKDFNLERLSEYYTNLFIIHKKSKSTKSDNNDIEILDMFMTCQVKLITSLIELNLKSETLDEIIEYLNIKVTENLSIK